MKSKESHNHTTIRNVCKREAAQMLGICVRTLEDLIYKREIEHVRIRAKVLIPYAEIERFNQIHTITVYEANAKRIA